MVYFLIILGLIALDQVVKWSVSNNMTVGQSIPIIQDIFHITYVRNTGAAFSIMAGQRLILVLIPVIIIIAGAIVLFVKRKVWHPTLKWAFALICAGGIGNLIDRAVNGFVVDMFDFRVFPVFNVADICVCVGCGLIFLYVIFISDKKDKNGR